MILGHFLQRAASDPAPWNCSTMPADWAIECGHPDFAAAWREIVEPDACEAAPREAGGLVRLWGQGIRDGLPVATSPFDVGDIGVITAFGLEAGAIFTGDKWAFRTPRGVHLVRLDDRHIIKAWRP